MLRAEVLGVGAIARRAGSEPVVDLSGVAPKCGHPRRKAGVPGVGRAVEGRAGRSSSQDRQARRERPLAGLCGPTALGRGAAPRRNAGRWAWGRLSGTGATSHIARTAGGCEDGARSRSRTGSGSSSPMASPWASATKRSTRPSMSKAAALSSESSWHACAPGGPCGSPEPGPATRPGTMSHPR